MLDYYLKKVFEKSSLLELNSLTFETTLKYKKKE